MKGSTTRMACPAVLPRTKLVRQSLCDIRTCKINAPNSLLTSLFIVGRLSDVSCFVGINAANCHLTPLNSYSHEKWPFISTFNAPN